MGVDTWILFDSGSAASGCPRDFAPDWPLLPFSGKLPPDGVSSWLHFCVCDVPYSVLSVSRLCCRGTRLDMEGKIVLCRHLLGKE